MVDVTEVELQIQDITEGSKFNKKVVLKSDNPAYDGKTVFVRSLTAREFAKITSGMSRDPDVGDSITLGLEACKIGIINKDLAKKVDELPSDVADQIGGMILGGSKMKEKAVKDFSMGQKDA